MYSHYCAFVLRMSEHLFSFIVDITVLGVNVYMGAKLRCLKSAFLASASQMSI